MRFEIRAGGAFVILLGLMGLSGAVFALGLVAGYEMARQTQPDINQISSVFPVPSPGAPEASAAATPAEAMASPAASTPQAAASVASAAQPSIAAPAMPTNAPVAHASPAAIARAKPLVVPPVARPSVASAPTAPPAAVASSSAEAAASRGKNFNIQIEAVMDKSGADAMVTRLKALGYEPHEMQTVIDGQTWYRVQIGPYATEEEARAAQAKLRAQYKSRYISPE